MLCFSEWVAQFDIASCDRKPPCFTSEWILNYLDFRPEQAILSVSKVNPSTIDFRS